MDANRIIVTGRLVRDPEMKYTQEGSPICNFSVAVNGYKDEVSFFNCVCFGKVAENLHKFQAQGSKILVEGKLKQNRYTDREGNKRQKIEIFTNTIFYLGSKNDNNKESYPDNNSNQNEFTYNEENYSDTIPY